MTDGYLYISRKLQDSWLWTTEPFTKGQAWVDMIMLANYEAGSILVRGIKVDIKRGQIGRSETTLCSRWGWSRSKLRNFLNMLEKEQQIVQQKTNVINVVTIINYDFYQKPYNKRTTERQQKDTNNKEKEKINTNNEGLPDWLDLELWQSFIEHRKFIKAPLSIQAQKVNLNQLQKLTDKGYSQEEIINLTIANGWKGFFEPKGDRNGANRQNNGQSGSKGNSNDKYEAVARAWSKAGGVDFGKPSS
jgi:hypothetical protein